MSIPTGTMFAISTATELAGHGMRAAANAFRTPFSFGSAAAPAAPSPTSLSDNARTAVASAQPPTPSDALHDRLQSLFNEARKSLAKLGFDTKQPFEVRLQPGESPVVQSEDLEFSLAMESWIREHPEAQSQLQQAFSQLSENQPGPLASNVASPYDKRRTTLQLLSTPHETRWKWRGE